MSHPLQNVKLLHNYRGDFKYIIFFDTLQWQVLQNDKRVCASGLWHMSAKSLNVADPDTEHLSQRSSELYD